MLKVTAVVDKTGTALDRLAQGTAKYNDNIDYEVIGVHPKRPDPEQLARLQARADSDIWDWQYFRTAEMIRSQIDLKGKHILTHNNPYSIHESDWNSYDAVVGNNKSIVEELEKITTAPLSHIPLTVDTDFWTFKREWTPNKTVCMVANRIESKKGILPVAQACAKLGLKLILVGAVSNAEYFHEVLKTGVVEFRQQISDEELRGVYWASTLHICNSVDNYESGTLPVLEAMLCGTPLLTRNIGHVPELNNKENMIINEGQPEDIEKYIEQAFSDTDKLNEMRGKAWDTAKTRSHERRAYMYQQLYREVMWPEQQSVSVVMPVYKDINPDTIEAVSSQDYENLELILCNDDPSYERHPLDKGALGTRLLRYINQPSKGYGLAKQRNLGIIEATGEIIVFCDQRMLMDKNAVAEFVKYLAPRRWVYGNKGAKKEFVENFSAVFRQDIINLGMFNERVNEYGGMSQEIRSRAQNAGFKLEYIESAKATPQGSSKNKHTKKQEIIRMKNMLWKLGL